MIGKLEPTMPDKPLAFPGRRRTNKNAQKISQGANIETSLICKCCNRDTLTQIRIKSGNELMECDNCGYVFNEKALSATDAIQIKRIPSSPSLNFIKRALSWLPNKKQHILVYSYENDSIAEYLQNKGHDVVRLRKGHNRLDPASDFNFPFRSFDLICCYHSLDYIEEPLATIKKLLQHLKGDGLLVIHTDFEAIDHLMLDPAYDKKRSSYFRYTTFEKMFEKLNHHIIYRNNDSLIIRKGI